ncbi:hypothetical protein N8I77_000124 [Diaporthe amygdali]|uniref:Uncharacterized protein n=1 Tax=Phomopsis amygdali TaxID=1214568 RepID=A0AAD9SNY8_PHOAM|nr:hypothetical protein N8I77_000124 [Diaporthe amygdali]
MIPTSGVMDLPPGIDVNPETLVGALGIAGLAAYFSFYGFVKEPRAGKTFWGIDVYYYCVGGEQLETTLTRMKDYGQIIASGMISTYHQPWALRTALHIVYKRLSVHGFICSNPHLLQKYMPTLPMDMATWLVQGKVKTKEEVVKGIENAPEAMLKMWTGDKFGKLVIEV